ncbi:ribonuclease HII [bacterium]|nr:MAG: ribonuclease HII [bacterium]
MARGLKARDEAIRRKGYPLLCGVDEAGRGPLAGPVVASAVVLDPGRVPKGIDDSKRLVKEERERLEPLIMDSAIAWGIGLAGPEEIDALNILRASLLAMERAISQLGRPPDFILVDGIHRVGSDLPQKTLIKGDSLSASVAAASILAKVHRDRLMAEVYAREYPGYGFEQHMGYATAEHREALKTLGPSPIHRRTFKGVREYLRDTPWPVQLELL